MTLLASVLATGIGATATMDLWSLVRRGLFGMQTPNYAHVGRWIGHMRHGRFAHPAISGATPVVGETLIGWVAHYLVGIGFAALFAWLAGPEWYKAPSLLPALALGTATVAAPFLVMQPAMGAGFAARRTPRPRIARMHSLINHLVFGAGLYASALAWQLVV